VQEKQSVTASVYLSSAITLGPWRQKGGLKGRKGDKFDHRPGRPKVLLRHPNWPLTSHHAALNGLNSCFRLKPTNVSQYAVRARRQRRYVTVDFNFVTWLRQRAARSCISCQYKARDVENAFESCQSMYAVPRRASQGKPTKLASSAIKSPATENQCEYDNINITTRPNDTYPRV